MRATLSYVRRALAERAAPRDIANNVTNSLLQDLLAGMNRQGLHGGLGDSRDLRDDIFRMVYKNLQRYHMGEMSDA